MTQSKAVLGNIFQKCKSDRPNKFTSLPTTKTHQTLQNKLIYLNPCELFENIGLKIDQNTENIRENSDRQ